MSKKTSRMNQEPPILNTKDNIQDIFMYKKAYEVHVKKLSQIRNMRKSNLKTNSLRNFQIQHIKDVKHNNFMYKMNIEASKICGDNLKLFQKLNKQMSANRGNRIQVPESMKIKRSMDLTASHNKIKRQKTISRQNLRMRERIKSSESHINNSKLIEEEKKRQEIRSRIRKFNANSELKSNRYFSAMSTRDNKQGSFSCNISNPNARRNSCEGVTHNREFSTKMTKEKKIISFYNPRDVILNKIQNFGLKYSNFKSINEKQKQQRPTTVQIIRKSRKQQTDSERRHHSFFATQTQ